MMELLQSNTREAGTWKPVRDSLPEHLKHLQRRFAVIVCPTCGLSMALGVGGHTIAKDGTITPSVVCPHKPCTFHEFVRLVGWEQP